MTPVTRIDLLDESLASPALVESLAATRAAARRRRIWRRSSRLGALAAVLATTLAILIRHPTRPESVARAKQAAVANPSFLAIATRPDPGPGTPAVSSPPVVVVATSKVGVMMVSTRLAPAPASEADLFAAAGPRPAALQRHPDGTSSWMWLDEGR